MHYTGPTINPQGPAWLKHLIGLGLLVAMAVALQGILLSVEYRWTTVLDVAPMAGRDASNRMVLIETPERVRVIRTSDRLVRIEKGAQVCISKRRLVARRWQRFDVELPGYCRSQPRTLPKQSVFVVD
jgi:hypothetical protein